MTAVCIIFDGTQISKPIMEALTTGITRLRDAHLKEGPDELKLFIAASGKGLQRITEADKDLIVKGSEAAGPAPMLDALMNTMTALDAEVAEGEKVVVVTFMGCPLAISGEHGINAVLHNLRLRRGTKQWRFLFLTMGFDSASFAGAFDTSPHFGLTVGFRDELIVESLSVLSRRIKALRHTASKDKQLWNSALMFTSEERARVRPRTPEETLYLGRDPGVLGPKPKPADWDDFEKKLKSHDWDYEYSDDSRVYNNGLASARHIQSLAARLRELDASRVDKLYQQYKPSALV